MKKLKLTKMEGACAPCALQYLSKKSDAKVLEAVVTRGMHDEDWIAAGKLLGIKLVRMQIEKQEVRKFLRDYSKGTYLVSTYDHVFVIEDGKMIDPRCPKPPGLRRSLISAWRVV